MRNLFNVLVIAIIMGTASTVAQNSQMPQQTEIEVSDSELSEFAKVFQQMRMLNQQAQQEMIEVVQDSDIELERFNEIHQGNMDPEKDVKTTAIEDKKYEVVVTKLESIQPEFQDKMKSLIDKSSLSIERYQQLAMALQSNASLQKRFQEMMKS